MCQPDIDFEWFEMEPPGSWSKDLIKRSKDVLTTYQKSTFDNYRRMVREITKVVGELALCEDETIERNILHRFEYMVRSYNFYKRGYDDFKHLLVPEDMYYNFSFRCCNRS